MGAQITFDEWVARLERAVDLLPQLLERKAAAIALRMQSAAKLNATTRPRARSGHLRRSIEASVKLRGYEGAVIRLGAHAHYAATQEFGATITGDLWIPLPPAKTAAGVSRWSSPREVPGLFRIRSRKGNLLLVRREGTGITPYYVHRTSVTVPATYFARRAFEQVQREGLGLDDLLAEALQEAA